jgi:hypothetical protein
VKFAEEILSSGRWVPPPGKGPAVGKAPLERVSSAFYGALLP